MTASDDRDNLARQLEVARQQLESALADMARFQGRQDVEARAAFTEANQRRVEAQLKIQDLEAREREEIDKQPADKTREQIDAMRGALEEVEARREESAKFTHQLEEAIRNATDKSPDRDPRTTHTEVHQPSSHADPPVKPPDIASTLEAQVLAGLIAGKVVYDAGKRGVTALVENVKDKVDDYKSKVDLAEKHAHERQALAEQTKAIERKFEERHANTGAQEKLQLSEKLGEQIRLLDGVLARKQQEERDRLDRARQERLERERRDRDRSER